MSSSIENYPSPIIAVVLRNPSHKIVSLPSSVEQQGKGLPRSQNRGPPVLPHIFGQGD